MIHFVLYRTEDGKIVATGSAPSMDIANAQARVGTAVLIVASLAGIADETHRVEVHDPDEQPARLVPITEDVQS